MKYRLYGRVIILELEKYSWLFIIYLINYFYWNYFNEIIKMILYIKLWNMQFTRAYNIMHNLSNIFCWQKRTILLPIQKSQFDHADANLLFQLIPH